MAKTAEIGNIIRFKYRQDASIELTGLVVAVNTGTVAVDITDAENFDPTKKMHERQLVKHGNYTIISTDGHYKNVKTTKGTDFFESGEVTTLKQDKLNGLTVEIYRDLIAQGYKNEDIRKKHNLNTVTYYGWKNDMGLTRKAGDKTKQQAPVSSAVNDKNLGADTAAEATDTNIKTDVDPIEEMHVAKDASAPPNQPESNTSESGLTKEQAIEAYQKIEKLYTQQTNTIKAQDARILDLCKEVKELSAQATVAHEMYQMQKQALVESEERRKAAEAKYEELRLIANDAALTVERQYQEMHHFSRELEAGPIVLPGTEVPATTEPLNAFTMYEEIMFRRLLALMDTV